MLEALKATKTLRLPALRQRREWWIPHTSDLLAKLPRWSGIFQIISGVKRICEIHCLTKTNWPRVSCPKHMLAVPRTKCFLRSNLSLKSCDWSSLTCMWTNGPSFFRLRCLVWRHLYKLISNWKFKINQLSEKVHLVFFTIKITISCKTASSAKRHHQLITSSGTNCF